jgi:hypothetical protein
MRNPTNLSFAGYMKWLFIALAAVTFLKAFQGIVQRKVATGGKWSQSFVTGDEAVTYGWQMFVFASVFAVASWTAWFFWQRHED